MFDRVTGDGFRDAAADCGLISGTRVATAMGWRPVEALTAGDKVLTFDHGMQPLAQVIRLRRTCRFAAPQDWPLLVPAGALGNATDAWVMPGQAILVESDIAEETMGDPFVLLTGQMLDGCGGIGPVLPDATLDIILLVFAEDEIIFTKAGLTCHCPGEVSGQYQVLAAQAAEGVLGGLLAA